MSSMSLIFIVVFAIMLILSVPIGWSLGASCVIAMLVSSDLPVAFVATRTVNSINSATLLSLPFFILAGDLMCKGGLSKRLVAFCQALLGWCTGGLGHVATLGCGFFAALSGSNVATTAAIGGIMIPEMVEHGYKQEDAAALVAASGTTGFVIPPSTPMIVYASIAGCSVTALFFGGILPGILMMLSCMVVTFIVAKKRKMTSVKWQGFRVVLKTFVNAVWALLMPVIILGGIYGGIFTPTEAAVVACVYSLIVSIFIYKEIKLKDIPKIFMESVETNGVGMIIICFASMLSWVLTVDQLPQNLANAFLTVTDSRIVMILLVDVILLIAGCFMSTTPAIVILTPILLPLAQSVGISAAAFGIIMIVNLAVGCVTPPVGSNISIAQTITRTPFEAIVKSVIPYVIALMVVLVIISIFPGICELLPKLMGM